MLARKPDIDAVQYAPDFEIRDDRAPFDPDLIFPRNSGERINLMIHFHRAEIARMASWRDRIDRTTNWAITVVAASLSFSFSSYGVSHVTLIACMIVVLFLLVIEARRYRFFDVFRCRVRTLERNYYAGLMSANLRPDDRWLERLGEDLRNPTFKLRLSDALKRRLRRNYIWLLLIVLLAWALKVSLAATASGADRDVFLTRVFDAASVGVIHGHFVVALVSVFYTSLCVFSSVPGRPIDHLPLGGVNV
jgi:uncharacterized membrane protein